VTAEAVAVLWGVGMLIAWSGVCWSAGAIWELRREIRAEDADIDRDMDRLERWANDTETRLKGGR
jgi:hypothetical protein